MQAKLQAVLKLRRWVLPVALIAFGLSYIIPVQHTEAASGRILSEAPRSAQSQSAKIRQSPTHLQISDIKLDITVKPGKYLAAKGQWEIDDHSAFFIDSSATPIIYGHNRASVFGNLHNVTENSTLALQYADHTTTYYTYYGTRFITPNDATILSEAHSDMIILMTCSGIWSDSRRIVYFQEIQS